MMNPVPQFARMLKSLDAILVKAEAHCAARKIDPLVLTTARLFPDMLPFTRQVLIATDHAKGATARLAGVEVPSFADHEKTFEELRARIAKTLEFISGFTDAQFEGAETRTVTIKVGGNDMSFPGSVYLSLYAQPNFFFHVTTAYDILRHNGLEIGKRDFLGG